MSEGIRAPGRWSAAPSSSGAGRSGGRVYGSWLTARCVSEFDERGPFCATAPPGAGILRHPPARRATPSGQTKPDETVTFVPHRINAVVDGQGTRLVWTRSVVRPK